MCFHLLSKICRVFIFFFIFRLKQWNFLEKLKTTNSNAVYLLWLIPSNPPCLLTSLYSSDYCSLRETELSFKWQKVLQYILISVEEASNPEKPTWKQSLCMQWYAHRSRRLTDSNFYSAYKLMLKIRVLHKNERS